MRVKLFYKSVVVLEVVNLSAYNIRWRAKNKRITLRGYDEDGNLQWDRVYWNPIWVKMNVDDE